MKIAIATVGFGILYGLLGAGLFTFFDVPEEHRTHSLVQAATFFILGCVWVTFFNYLHDMG